jgi:hypothetical protein
VTVDVAALAGRFAVAAENLGQRRAALAEVRAGEADDFLDVELSLLALRCGR